MTRTDLSHPLADSDCWPAQGAWKYEDYCRLPVDGWRYEVIDGKLYMNRAPRPIHQEVIMQLGTFLNTHARAQRLGKVYAAPIDVLLGERATPVQPDLLFIREDNLAIVEETSIRGAPDLIVEILSPSNWTLDRRVKFEVYAGAGVAEYWIVDTGEKRVEGYHLDHGQFVEAFNVGLDGRVQSSLLPGLEIDVREFLPE